MIFTAGWHLFNQIIGTCAMMCTITCLPVETWGFGDDFEMLLVIKLQLSLPASRPAPPSASAAFCRSPFESVSGRSSRGDVIHESICFLAHHSPQTSLSALARSEAIEDLWCHSVVIVCGKWFQLWPSVGFLTFRTFPVSWILIRSNMKQSCWQKINLASRLSMSS